MTLFSTTDGNILVETKIELSADQHENKSAFAS